MNEHETLWERIQELFDERRDPFEDPEVNEALLADPAALEEVTRLRGSLLAIERGSRPVSRWRAIGMPIAASLVGLLALGEFASRGSVSVPEEPPELESTARWTHPPSIQQFQLNVVTESGSRRVTTHFDGETYSRRIDLLPPSGTDEASRLANTTLSTLSSRRLPR